MTLAKGRHDVLIIVISVTVVLGMAVAILLLLLWREHPTAIAEGAGLNAAVAVCPPFMLVHIARDMDDTALSMMIIGVAVVVGNGSLYAGVAMFVMWVTSRVWPKRK